MDKLVNEKVEDTLHIYLRVSSTAQIKEGFGIENQRKLGEKVAKGLGLIPKIWNEGDKSASSENIEERPILEELLNNVDDGIVKKVWAFANDRLSRNENIWNHIRIKLRTNECRLYIGEGSEQNLKNDLDDFIFGIMAEVSKYDQRLRTNRLRRGKFSKISKGGWKGGPTPFGYDNIDGFLEINKNEGKWVKRIYEEYSKGTSIYAIKQLLMRNGVLSRRGNVVWSDQSIRVILTNTYYEGFWTYYDKVLKQNIRNDCQRLIPSNIIKKVRKRFEETTTTSNYIKYETLLRDKLVCGHCGSKYGQRVSNDPTQKKSHYFCRGNGEKLRADGGLDKIVCKTDNTENGRVRSVSINEADTLVWDSIIEVLEKSNLFKEMFKKEYMGEVKSFGRTAYEIKGYERRIKKNDRTIKDINESINAQMVEGILDVKDQKQFKSVVRKFEAKKTELIAENEMMINEIDKSKNAKKWVNWIDDFKIKIEDLKSKNWKIEEKSKFIKEIIDKIEVFTLDKTTHKLLINFNSPFVNDELVWNVEKQPKKGYKIKEGLKELSINLTTFNKRGRMRGTKKK